jgi:hypothetical protein
VLDQLAAGRGLALVCVQPLLVYRSREGEDLTRDKSDPKDAVLIARLASELRCYEPERADAVWARLRHLGARRRQLTTDATAQVNQIRDLLECAWPAVLGASGSPFRSATWCAALAVVLDRCAGDLGRVARLGPARFEGAVRRELPRWGATRPCLRIVRALYAALGDPAGVMVHRPGALERAHLALGDWRDIRVRLAGAEARMVAVLDDLGLTALVTTIAGLTPPALPRSSPRPAIRPASPHRDRWSSTPGCARATTPPASTRARPPSPAAGGLACGWPPDGRSGQRCRTTRSWPPGSPT